ADRFEAFRLPAARGLRRLAALGDLVPDRLPDRGAAAGLGRRDAGAPAPGAARAPAGPPPALAGDPGAARASLLGGKAATLRDSRLRPPVGRAGRERARSSRGGMMAKKGALRIGILAPV